MRNDKNICANMNFSKEDIIKILIFQHVLFNQINKTQCISFLDCPLLIVGTGSLHDLVVLIWTGDRCLSVFYLDGHPQVLHGLRSRGRGTRVSDSLAFVIFRTYSAKNCFNRDL